MKKPVLILCEIDTDEYPDFREGMPGAVHSALNKVDLITPKPVTCFSFYPTTTYDEVEKWLNSREFESIIEDWYNF